MTFEGDMVYFLSQDYLRPSTMLRISERLRRRATINPTGYLARSVTGERAHGVQGLQTIRSRSVALRLSPAATERPATAESAFASGALLEALARLLAALPVLSLVLNLCFTPTKRTSLRAAHRENRSLPRERPAWLRGVL
jgi:hypothetical protein